MSRSTMTSTPIDVVASTDDDGLTAAASHTCRSRSRTKPAACSGARRPTRAGRRAIRRPRRALRAGRQGRAPRLVRGKRARPARARTPRAIERRARVADRSRGALRATRAGSRSSGGRRGRACVVAKAACASSRVRGSADGNDRSAPRRRRREPRPSARRRCERERRAWSSRSARRRARVAPRDSASPTCLASTTCRTCRGSSRATAPSRRSRYIRRARGARFLLAAAGLRVVAWLAIGRLPRRWRVAASARSTPKVAGTAASVEVRERGRRQRPPGGPGRSSTATRARRRRERASRSSARASSAPRSSAEAIADADGAFVLAATRSPRRPSRCRRPPSRCPRRAGAPFRRDPDGARLATARPARPARRLGPPQGAGPTTRRRSRPPVTCSGWRGPATLSGHGPKPSNMPRIPARPIDAEGEAEVDRLAPGDARTPRSDAPGLRAAMRIAGGPDWGGPEVPPGARRPVGGPGAR